MRTYRPAIVVAALLTSWLIAVPASAGTPTVQCRGERATIVGTEQDDVLTGTPHRDVIAGLGGDDRIYGEGGNDLICGGFGADRIEGGPGDDDIFGGKDRVLVTEEETERLGDTIHGGPGDDTLTPGLDERPADDITLDVLSWEAAAEGPITINMATGTARGEGHDDFDASQASVVGSSYADTIIGTDGDDRIFAGPGGDTVRAGDGDDRVVDDAQQQHGRSRDLIRGGAGDDEISVTKGSDEVSGGPGNDFIDDFDNSVDSIAGGSGDDHVVGEIVAAADTQHYTGGPGIDAVDFFTNRVNPTAAASTGHWDMATGEATYQLGDTTVQMVTAEFEIAGFNTYGTSWTIDGSPLADTVQASGTTGTTFHGLAGDDTFSGSGGDDTFDGGPGTDHALVMGDGDDTCISVELLDQADCENIIP